MNKMNQWRRRKRTIVSPSLCPGNSNSSGIFLEAEVSDYLIPIYGIKQGNIGNKKKYSPSEIYETHDG
jgi:hypothetical protein